MKTRRVRVCDGLCYILLSRGKEAICDIIDFDLVSGHNWCAQKGRRTFYALTNVRTNGGQASVMIHRMILNPSNSRVQVDHVDGNGLNNRRNNLRLCSSSGNNKNRRLNINSSSGFKGVSWHKSTKKWQAYIKLNDKQIYLGSFAAKESAALAYNKAAKEFHHVYAKLNNVKEV